MNSSAKLYTADSFNELIRNETVSNIKMHSNEISFTKIELKQLLDSHVVGGVFRLKTP